MGWGGEECLGLVQRKVVEAVWYGAGPVGAGRSNRFHFPQPQRTPAGHITATSTLTPQRMIYESMPVLPSISITWCPYILSYHTKSSKWVPECDSKRVPRWARGGGGEQKGIVGTNKGGVSGITDGGEVVARVQWPPPTQRRIECPGVGPIQKKYVRKNEDNTTVFFFLYEWDLSCDARTPNLWNWKI